MSSLTGRRRSAHWSTGAVVLTIVVAGLAAAYWRDWGGDRTVGPLPVISREPLERAASEEFVGTGACAKCHADIAASFAAHPMAQSLLPVSRALPIEDYTERTTIAPPGPRRYFVERVGDRVRHHEKMPGIAAHSSSSEVDDLYDQAVDIGYVIGSGEHGRGYLIERDGQFFASSISWYTKKGRWDLSPGYEPEKHPRFERAVREECLFCHAGRTSRAQPAASRFADPPFRETAIGCERCHGSGRRHVDEEESGTRSAGEPSIVNPARLDHERRDSVCNQCHLHGELRVVRYGQRLDDFRPGRRLEEVLCVLVRPPPPDDQRALRAVSQVEQMRASACFVKSNGALGCISCHDPHALEEPANRASGFRRRCLACHAERNCSLPESERQAPPANDSCVHCHMPEMAGGGIPHTAQTDHRIQRRPAAVRETAPLDPTELLFFDDSNHDDSEQQVPEWERWRARGIMLVDLGNMRNDRIPLAVEAERLLRAALDHAPDDIEMLQRLGGACLAQSRPADALECWERALAREPDRAETLLVYALLCNTIGQNEKAARSFERFIRLNPAHSQARGQYAGLLAKIGNWELAVAVAEKALELDPTWIGVRKLLADGYRELGRNEESRRERRLVSRMAALGE
jgi:hypothetical protein